jgi:hypothetical protein
MYRLLMDLDGELRDAGELVASQKLGSIGAEPGLDGEDRDAITAAPARPRRWGPASLARWRHLASAVA